MQQDETSPNVDRYEISIVDREAAGLNADFEPTIRNIVGVRIRCPTPTLVAQALENEQVEDESRTRRGLIPGSWLEGSCT